MKLYEIPRHSKIHCNLSDGSSYVMFDHIDGMYSFCVSEKGGVCHLKASTPLVKDGEDYRIQDDGEEEN